MLSLEMLDVAIGMIFVYLLISLICSAINEFVEAKLKLRAVDLEQGIRGLLNDYDGTGLTKKIYNHPLVYSLFRGDYEPEPYKLAKSDKSTKPVDDQNKTNLSTTSNEQNELEDLTKSDKPAKLGEMRVNNNDAQKNRYSRGSDLPSYIPARNFALALMDVLLPANGTTKSGTEGAIAAPNDHLPTPNSTGTQLPPVNQNPLKPLRDAICNEQDSKVQSALLTIIDAAGDDVSKAREGIENWYNSGMDRVSGWYKRRVQTILFWMGFGIAIIMNADSFAIFNNLINDRPLRAAVVSVALDKQHSLQDTTADSLRKNVNALVELGLPIGWNWKSKLNNSAKAKTNFNAIPPFTNSSKFRLIDSLGSWFLKIIGWLVTGFAVSLGAPFWFDTLNRIMIIRSTVKPHEKSPEEASQDRQNPKT